MSNKKYMIDLFSGCGGLSFGFEQAGFECIVGVDFDKPALETFKYNHPNASAIHLDLSKEESITEIISKIDNRKINLIVAGPPCQGFSLSGNRDETDKRNILFYSVFKLAASIKPKYIVIENVPGIATLYKGKAREAVLEEFERLGYTCSEKILYAPDYGVPQIRKRMFFVGVLGDKVFEFPEPTHHKANYLTCWDAISDLPSLENNVGSQVANYLSEPLTIYQDQMRDGAEKLFNHVGTNHSSLVVSVIKQVPEGGNHKDLPEGVGTSRKFNEAWTRYHSEKPSKTIDTGHRNHFHYKWHRVPTARENARLQSFPDSFRFLGSKTQQEKQVGNAVPPRLGYALGKQILSLE